MFCLQITCPVPPLQASSLTESLTGTTATLREADAQVQALTGRLTDTTSRLTSLQQQHDALQARHAAAVKQLETSEADKGQLQVTLKATKGQVQSLQTEAVSLQASHTSVQSLALFLTVQDQNSASILNAEIMCAGQRSMLNRLRRICMFNQAEQVPQMTDSKSAPVMLHFPCTKQLTRRSRPCSWFSQQPM